MLTLSEDALVLIAERQQPVFIDVPETIQACCLAITTCPTVHFGTPREPHKYTQQQIQGANVFVPHDLPSTLDLSIHSKTFLSRKSLFIAGWKLV